MANKQIADFLAGKSPKTVELYHHFVDTWSSISMISIHPAKTMIGISNGKKRIAYITRLGRDFIHVYFPFTQPYPDNLCFVKIAQVPGDNQQFNHHFRMLEKDDINEEVVKFMVLAYG